MKLKVELTLYSYFKRANIRYPINARIKKAGIEAIAHLTMKTTIDINGIFISKTTTPWLGFILSKSD